MKEYHILGSGKQMVRRSFARLVLTSGALGGKILLIDQ